MSGAFYAVPGSKLNIKISRMAVRMPIDGRVLLEAEELTGCCDVMVVYYMGDFVYGGTIELELFGAWN